MLSRHNKSNNRAFLASPKWFTESLWSLKQQGQALERRRRKDRSQLNKSLYSIHLHLYHRAIRKAKCTYFAKHILRSSNASAEAFSFAKELTQPICMTATTSFSTQRCQDLIEYKVKSLRQNIQHGAPVIKKTCLLRSQFESSKFTVVPPNQVTELVAAMKPTPQPCISDKRAYHHVCSLYCRDPE